MERLRLNITGASPGYVECSLFQSDNGINWGCVGTGITFPEEWFRETFGSDLEVGRRVEFQIGAFRTVTD